MKKRTTREQRRAHKAVRRAIDSGRLVRPETCERCGSKGGGNNQPHAHHADYEKPLDVEWLCVSCHNQEADTGSMNRGEGSGLAILTQAQVDIARLRYALGECTQVQLASQLGISRGQMSKIINRKRWP